MTCTWPQTYHAGPKLAAGRDTETLAAVPGTPMLISAVPLQSGAIGPSAVCTRNDAGVPVPTATGLGDAWCPTTPVCCTPTAKGCDEPPNSTVGYP